MKMEKSGLLSDLLKIWRNGQVKASLTVEASILIPFILFMITGGIRIGFGMFKEAREAIEIREELVKLDPLEIVRRNTWMKGVKGE